MNREEQDKELDEWLARAASEYGRAETRPGFEARVIASVNCRLEKRKWYLRWIPIAAAAVIVLSFGILLIRFQNNTVVEEATAKRPVLETAEVHTFLETTPKPEPALRAGRLWTAAPHIPAPRKPTRLFSSELTDRERYLIAFTRAVAESAEPQRFQLPALEIPKFQIPEPEIFTIERD